MSLVTPKSRTVYVFDVFKLDELIIEHLNQDEDYTLIADMEWSNDTSHQGSNTDELLDFEEKDLADFITGTLQRGSVGLNQILTALARLDVIPFGEYVIEVCW